MKLFSNYLLPREVVGAVIAGFNGPHTFLVGVEHWQSWSREFLQLVENERGLNLMFVGYTPFEGYQFWWLYGMPVSYARCMSLAVAAGGDVWREENDFQDEIPTEAREEKRSSDVPFGGVASRAWNSRRPVAVGIGNICFAPVVALQTLQKAFAPQLNLEVFGQGSRVMPSKKDLVRNFRAVVHFPYDIFHNKLSEYIALAIPTFVQSELWRWTRRNIHSLLQSGGERRHPFLGSSVATGHSGDGEEFSVEEDAAGTVSGEDLGESREEYEASSSSVDSEAENYLLELLGVKGENVAAADGENGENRCSAADGENRCSISSSAVPRQTGRTLWGGNILGFERRVLLGQQEEARVGGGGGLRGENFLLWNNSSPPAEEQAHPPTEEKGEKSVGENRPSPRGKKPGRGGRRSGEEIPVLPDAVLRRLRRTPFVFSPYEIDGMFKLHPYGAVTWSRFSEFALRAEAGLQFWFFVREQGVFCRSGKSCRSAVLLSQHEKPEKWFRRVDEKPPNNKKCFIHGAC